MGWIARWLLALGVLLLVAPAWADHGSHARVPVQVGRDLRAPTDGSAEKYFSNVPLTDQHGNTHRFYSDLLSGKVVVVNSFYTSCTQSCPVIMRTLAEVRETLGDRVDRDITFLSLTSDPAADTPPRLRAYAERMGIGPGWRLLTGKADDVRLALAKIGQRVQSKDDHLNLLIIGNDRTGLWKKAFAMAPREELTRLIAGVAGNP